MVKPSKSNLEKITNLCERYSVLVDDVDLVDVYLGSDDEASRDDIPEKFQKALL